jgi:capsular exopolysaccharide synthesis family protein
VTDQTLILPPDPSGNGHGANYRLTMMVPKRRFLSYLRERWWVVLVSITLFLGAVIVYETIRPPSYRSFAQLYVSSDTPLSPMGFLTEDSQNYFGTQIELLKSARLQAAVYEKLGVSPKPGQKAPVEINVTQPLKTSLLDVQATGSDADLVQRFLQALIDEYLAYKKETRLASSEDLLISITAQVARKAEDLQAEQEKFTEFQKTNNVAVLEADAKSAGMYLSDLNLQLAKLRLERKILSEVSDPAGMTSMASQTNEPDTAPISSAEETITNDVSKDDDSSLKSARVELAVMLGDKEERVRAMGEHRFEEEVARLQRLVSILESDLMARKGLEMQDLDKRMEAISEAIPAWEARMLDINNRLAQAQRMKSNIERQQEFYDHLLSTMQNVDLNKNVQQERLSLLQPAASAKPETRSLLLRIALAVVGGTVVSVGMVFVWYLLDDRLVSVRDIRDQFGETILGLVPQIRVPRANPERALLESNDSRTAYAESFRHLRSALLLSEAGETPAQPRTVLFTSAMPNEGKTTVAINVARVLAKSGLRVALVNADLHSAGGTAAFGESNGHGLVNFLRGEVDLSEILHPSNISGLTVVPSGAHAGEEGLFLRRQLEELIKSLREQNEFVILDGPSVLSADDAALLVPHADSVVLVTRPFHTRSRSIRQALDMLYQRRAKQVAIILNRARAEDLAGYYEENGRSLAGKNAAGTRN